MSDVSIRWHRRGVGRALLAFILMVSWAALLIIVPAGEAEAACSNPVACENALPGNPESEWGISGAGSSSIQGFATDMSVNVGTTVGFKVRTSSRSYRLDIYRMGYYAGLGARRVASVNPTAFPTQPACLTQSSTGLIDCGNWAQTASWSVPSTAVSGIYFAKLVAGTATSHIFFIVRNDASTSDLLFQTADTTWQAYNSFGGNSLYTGGPVGRAYKVSYNRPFNTNAGVTEQDFVWNAEYPMVRFLEANGYDLSYISGIDSDRLGSLIKNHKTFVSVGHDEYWSGAQRKHVEDARDAGVNLAFFSGNEVFWKTRWEPSISTGSAPYRTLVSYKETLANAKIDPAVDASGKPIWTGTWRDPRFSPPGDGGRPENNLTGTVFAANCCTTDMHVSGAYAALRFWRNTRVTSLAPNQTTTLGSGILGYEWDESPDNGHRPAGLIHLSTDSQNVSSYLQDYGSSYSPGTATHHLALYRAPSGALVFGAGSIQWSWGLDDQHAIDTSGTSDVAVKQATVNLFADMGVQPTTLQSGLTPATASTDTTPASSTITAPAAGAEVPVGQPLTISGTAADTGGGVVAGVEVTVDDGLSWHPATGGTSWSYTFTPGSDTTLKIRSRATDDSARTETPAPARSVTVGDGPPAPGSCPCTIWPSSTVPLVAADPDTSSIEIGVKFRANQAGSITGIRFYQGPGNTGTRVGSLWSSSGVKLASATFANDTTTGWKQVLFSSPVAISANTTYVASYFAPNGRYAVSDGYFTSPVANGPLTALQDNAEGPNGVYRYGTSGFPTQGYAASNYWVDVVFTSGSAPDTTAPTITARQPAAGATGVATSTAVSATFSEPVQQSTVAMTVAAGATQVAGTLSYNATNNQATFTPNAPLAATTQYTATVSGAKDIAGNTMTTVTWTFTTATADVTAPTVTAHSPAAGATNVATSTPVSATFSEPVQQSTIAMTLAAGATQVAGTLSYNATTNQATFTPSAPLATSTQYTATVAEARDAAGNTMAAPERWTFTTASSGCPCTIWPSTATPALAADPDTDAVELGVKFRATQSGSITGIRFYKAAANTGTHTGSLWSSTGTRLATATFSGESASGWQQVTFATPVAVTANTTYVASYHAPNGRYSVDENYFAAAVTRGPLTALANGTDGPNGVFRYGASAFPTSSYRSSNYWIDVVFTTN